MRLALNMGMVNLRLTGPTSVRSDAPYGLLRVSRERMVMSEPPAGTHTRHNHKAPQVEAQQRAHVADVGLSCSNMAGLLYV